MHISIHTAKRMWPRVPDHLRMQYKLLDLNVPTMHHGCIHTCNELSTCHFRSMWLSGVNRALAVSVSHSKRPQLSYSALKNISDHACDVIWDVIICRCMNILNKGSHSNICAIYQYSIKFMQNCTGWRTAHRYWGHVTFKGYPSSAPLADPLVGKSLKTHGVGASIVQTYRIYWKGFQVHAF